MRKVILVIFFLIIGSYLVQAKNDVRPELISLHPAFTTIVHRSAQIEELAHGFSWVEGPVWNPSENSLLFSDVGNNQVLKWKQGYPIAVFLNPSGYTGDEPFAGHEPGSNGLAFDPKGRLVLCQHGDRKISRLEQDGSIVTIVDRYKGKRLNSPNDLVFNSRGDMYFTDPPFGLPKTFDDPSRELDFQGVYRYSKEGELTLLDKDLNGPNGIAFSPDQKKLYVSDAAGGAWFVFDLRKDGTLLNKRKLLSARHFQKYGPGAPDGIKVDKNGVLFTAGPGGIYVIAPNGTVLGLIRFGVPVGNCAWGEKGSTLFITANTALYRLRL